MIKSVCNCLNEWGLISIVLQQTGKSMKWLQMNQESSVNSFTCICHGVKHLQSVSHAIGKQSSILLAAKVEPPHLPGVPPLVEIGCGLVILEISHDRTVYHHLATKEDRLSIQGFFWWRWRTKLVLLLLFVFNSIKMIKVLKTWFEKCYTEPRVHSKNPTQAKVKEKTSRNSPENWKNH